MKAHFSLTKRVEFADTDAAGIMHFSNYFRFMEICEHAFVRSLGFSVFPAEGDGAAVGWPRVQVACDYRLPLYFEDEVKIELVVKKLSSKTIDYEFLFWKKGGDLGKTNLVASGKFTVICVAWRGEGQKMKAVEIPSKMREQLEGVRIK
ncbi:MAG: acyl-CoA thioesterase [Verrucomicrobiales bacterium]|nr:acyl-CoA thioesterase [Verrucomicrobiales bacterium]